MTLITNSQYSVLKPISLRLESANDLFPATFRKILEYFEVTEKYAYHVCPREIWYKLPYVINVIKHLILINSVNIMKQLHKLISSKVSSVQKVVQLS